MGDMQEQQKTIIAFGYFNQEGSRHWVICEGLRAHGYSILNCNTEKKGFIPKCRDLCSQYRSLRDQADIVLVPFMGHYILPLAWLLTRRPRKTLVFDVFISLYDTNVQDRGLYGCWHPRAWMDRLIDRLSCTLADAVLVDTEEHKQYFVKRYNINPKKMITVLIGCRTDIFQPSKRVPADPIVTFHGKYIPLQGVDTILRAAALLPSVQFQLIGKGQTYTAMTQLADGLELTNVQFVDTVPMSDLPSYIHRSSVCLGIFGTTDKADRVIPHKAYEILACKKPLITGNTAASRSFFRNRENVLLATCGNAQDLADKIQELLADSTLRDRIAENGHLLSLERCQPKDIVSELVTWLEKFSLQA